MLEEIFNDFLFRDPAKKMVAYAHKKYQLGNEMYYFVILNGIGAGRLAIAPGDEHNYKMIIDAIHDYQAKHPKKKVKEGYTEAILRTIQVIAGKELVYRIFDYFNYEFEKQKNGTSAFRLDYEILFAKLKDKIYEKYDTLKGDDPNFDRWIKTQMELLEQKSWAR